MFLLENTISFFKKLDELAGCILDTTDKASEEEDWDFVGLLFSTGCKLPQLDNQTFIKAFSLIPEEKDEEREESDYLSYADLIKVSIDNTVYYNLSPCADENVLETIEKSKQGKNCDFYICDLTEKFYCKITDENKDYFFDKINEQLTSEKSEETGNPFNPSRKITLHYYNIESAVFHLFKQASSNEKLQVDFEAFKSPVLFAIDFESYEEVNDVELTPVSSEAVWESEWGWKGKESFFNSDGEDNDYKGIVKPFIDRIRSKRKERLASDCPDTLDLFDRKIKIDKSPENTDKMNILASVVSSICYDFDLGGIYSKIHREVAKEYGDDYKGFICEETLKKCYSLLVEKTVDEGISFESVSQNLLAVYEEYYMLGVNNLGIKESLKANPATYLMYESYKSDYREFGEEVYRKIMKKDSNGDDPNFDLPSFKYINDFFIAMGELEEKRNRM